MNFEISKNSVIFEIRVLWVLVRQICTILSINRVYMKKILAKVASYNLRKSKMLHIIDIIISNDKLKIKKKQQFRQGWVVAKIARSKVDIHQ